MVQKVLSSRQSQAPLCGVGIKKHLFTTCCGLEAPLLGSPTHVGRKLQASLVDVNTGGQSSICSVSELFISLTSSPPTPLHAALE